MKNPSLLLNTKTMLATVALTGLMAGAAARVQASPTSGQSALAIKGALATVVADGDKNSCKGQNSCKGKGGCKTGDNGCKGKNTCKGKGGCKSSG
jgi:hypothetical protein